MSTALTTGGRTDLGDSVTGIGTDPGPLAETPAGTDTRPADRSDEELLAALDAVVDRTSRRPTRQEVMAEVGVGTGRATRLMAVLEQRHGWPPATDTKRSTAKPTAGLRSGTGTRSQTRRSQSSTPATSPGTDPAGTSTEPATVLERAPVGRTGPQGGRFVSWLGFGFGSVASIAANVLHAWLPPAGASHGWHPGLVPQIGAAVWPVALLLAVEVLSRVRWRNAWQWRLARYGGAGTVAVGAAVISYGHVRDVLVAWGYGVLAAHVGPLVIDGLMVISGFALLSTTAPSTSEEQAV